MKDENGLCRVIRLQEREMLDGLRDLGLLHLAEKKSPARAASERFTTLSKTAGVLLDYAPDKNPRGKKKLRSFRRTV